MLTLTEQQIAQVLADVDWITDEDLTLIAERFADTFTADHGLRFDREQFMANVGVEDWTP